VGVHIACWEASWKGITKQEVASENQIAMVKSGNANEYVQILLIAEAHIVSVILIYFYCFVSCSSLFVRTAFFDE